MITRFHVENYKALPDVTLDLTPIHVLIGPNDSGKTSVLEAVAALSRTAEDVLARAFPEPWQGRELVWWGTRDGRVAFEITIQESQRILEYRLVCQFPESGTAVTPAEERARVPGNDAKTINLSS